MTELPIDSRAARIPNKDALLDDFAIRAFRDIADHDYIAARLAYRHGLLDQFLWSGQQAIEKYLKAILLFNRISATNVGHDLSAALRLIERNAPFTVRLSPVSQEIVTHLDTYGKYRYFETSPYVRGEHLHALDLAVWEIRRYCQQVRYKIRGLDGTEREMLDLELQRIERSNDFAPHKFALFNGELETILKRRAHPARGALVYKNFRFGSVSRKRLSMGPMSQSKNSPLLLHPEILEEVRRYVFLPREVLTAYRPRMEEVLARLEASAAPADPREQ